MSATRRHLPLLVPGWVVLGLGICLAGAGRLPAAEPSGLVAEDRRFLEQYLRQLESGQPGSAAAVDRLAEIPFADLLRVVRSYAGGPAELPPPVHRAYQALLERTSRTCLLPWPLVRLYAPDLAEFMLQSPAENPVARPLLDRLLASDEVRRPHDLAVRLVPLAALEHLAAGRETAAAELLEAWNRRLASGEERRPLPGLAAHLAAIAARFALDEPADVRAARLRFLASWPQLREAYERALGNCLARSDARLLRDALAVQQRFPARLDSNAGLVRRAGIPPEIQELALRNFAYDTRHDHSATLRGLWADLPAEDGKLRYACLFSMGLHPAGNEELALEAVRSQSFDLFDVAVPLLRRAPAAVAAAAIDHALHRTPRSHEEALRLALDRKLDAFVPTAVAIAQDVRREQAVRQTALRYLQLADGATRRKLAPLVTHPNADLRLAALAMLREVRGLGDEDFAELGPLLVQVALSDPSSGHRQEALYVLGGWRKRSAAAVFQKVVADHPPVDHLEGHYNDAVYWQYRLRLVALLGLAKLGDAQARSALDAIHQSGTFTERMDVLLAYLDLGQVPPFVWDDLNQSEPRLVATAAQLIVSHGDAADRRRLREFFARTPLWRELAGSGIDDFNLLELGGLRTAAPGAGP